MNDSPTISMVVAMARDGLIGTKEGLPWHLPSDLKRFRLLTTGKPIILGRKTAQLIGKPLPNRRNIVLTSDRNFQMEGCVVVHSSEDAKIAARQHLLETNGDEIMIVGGARVYQEFFHQYRRIYLTVVEGSFQGTTYFPVNAFDELQWTIAARENVPADEKNKHSQTFYLLELAQTESNKNEHPPQNPVTLSQLLRDH